jgi:DNA-binding transcriptional regulator WhiA
MKVIDQNLVKEYKEMLVANPNEKVHYEISWANVDLAKGYASQLNSKKMGIVFSSKRNKLIFECRNRQMSADFLPRLAAMNGYKGKFAMIIPE